MQSYTLDSTGFYAMDNPKRRGIKKMSNSIKPTDLSAPPAKGTSHHSSDRFIPTRANINVEFSNYLLTQQINDSGAEPKAPTSPRIHRRPPRPDPPPPSPPILNRYERAYQEVLLNTMFDTPSHYSQVKPVTELLPGEVSLPPARVLSFEPARTTPRNNFDNNLKTLYSLNRYDPSYRTERTVKSTPLMILDAPDIVDDFYLNLLDWNDANVLAVALGNQVYLWNASTREIRVIFTTDAPQDIITSIAWADDTCLAFGTTYSGIYIWDCKALQKLRHFRSHTARVSSLSWKRPGEQILCSSGSDTKIVTHDIRCKEHEIARFCGHTAEVCGLKWSPDGKHFASGGNDNLINVWDLYTSDIPIYTFTQHKAAVKALAWCPWQSDLLASGGGTSDKTIKFWNTNTGTCLKSVDTGSQVCSIIWSKYSKELVSSHGFSRNHLCIWKYPGMTKIAELTGHESRVLYTALSPDGTTVVSAAGDETLRFWEVFEPSKDNTGQSSRFNSTPAQKLVIQFTAELNPRTVFIR